eukprot:gene7471-375_t
MTVVDLVVILHHSNFMPGHEFHVNLRVCTEIPVHMYLVHLPWVSPSCDVSEMHVHASLLYVLLFFQPDILHSQKQIMREIVDKHYPDNWVISYYLGFTVDLTMAWQNYKAASSFIKNTLDVENVQYHLKLHQKAIGDLLPEMAGYMREGVMTESFILDNIGTKLLPCIRSCNVTLKWFVLHSTRGQPGRRINSDFKKIYEIINKGINT